MSNNLRIDNLEAFVFRAPLANPVEASFGLMLDRPMVLVKVTDHDGAFGWGEVWCNFPAVGAEHRARLVMSILRPLLTSGTFNDPADAFSRLMQATAVMAIQCAEPGPFAQTIAGIDIALWDLAARRAGKPLWKHLGGSSDRIAVYASGLNPNSPELLAEERHQEGHRAFKLKIGFGSKRDAANLDSLRKCLGHSARLMVDANQAWSIDGAMAMLPVLIPYGLDWLEEPIRADSLLSDWRRLADASSIPLAGGENIMGIDGFEAAIKADVFGVIQPDLAKWGGFSGCRPVARRIIAVGRRFCPHYLGGGIGLLASAHLLAAVGGNGALEIDANSNPLRTEIAQPLARILEGHAALGDAAGLGIGDPLPLIERFRVPF